MTKWISVKDKLPELNKSVLTYSLPKGDITIAELPAGYINHPDSRLPLFMGGFRGLIEVSHWMPLPEPPTDETHHDPNT